MSIQSVPELTAFVTTHPALPFGSSRRIFIERRSFVTMRTNQPAGISLERARNFVNSFEFPAFKPYLSSNPTFQTVASNFWPPAPKVDYTRIKLPTADGLDELDIDIAGGSSLVPEESKASKPIALLLHGLESCSSGAQTLRLADTFSKAGFKVIALNYRSCAANSKPPATLKLYHAGFTEDVETVLLAIRSAATSNGAVPPRVYMCGFSLGANILCNVLRMVGERATEGYGIVAAFGFCIPFDPKNCQATIDSGYRQVLYSGRLARSIVGRFEDALNAGADVSKINVDRARKAQTIGEVDDELISPVFGFTDKFDYYRQVDARPCLKYITVPTLILNARDDPFFGHENGKSLPSETDIADAPVRVIISQSGGHCGFLDYPGASRKEPMFGARLGVQFALEVEKTFYAGKNLACVGTVPKHSSVESSFNKKS